MFILHRCISLLYLLSIEFYLSNVRTMFRIGARSYFRYRILRHLGELLQRVCRTRGKQWSCIAPGVLSIVPSFAVVLYIIIPDVTENCYILL